MARRIRLSMCDTTSRDRHPESRPRWQGLYGSVLPQLAALALVEAARPPTAVRTLVGCVIAVATFVAMAWWLRINRAALDLQQWCDCASRTLTLRVIESHRPAPSPPLELPPPVTDDELVHV
jgi:hypothetical protein